MISAVSCPKQRNVVARLGVDVRSRGEAGGAYVSSADGDARLLLSCHVRLRAFGLGLAAGLAVVIRRSHPNSAGGRHQGAAVSGYVVAFVAATPLDKAPAGVVSGCDSVVATIAPWRSVRGLEETGA